MTMTTKDYCDNIRKVGRALASGEIKEYRMSLVDLAEHLSGDDYHKVTKNMSYTRTTINRVPEVKAVGTINIKIEESALDKEYVFTLNRDAKRKVITNEDLPRLEQSWKRKFIKHLLQTHPRFTDLEGEKLEGAVEMIKRYEEMLNEMSKEGDQ